MPFRPIVAGHSNVLKNIQEVLKQKIGVPMG